jgi:hypothetical protein
VVWWLLGVCVAVITLAGIDTDLRTTDLERRLLGFARSAGSNLFKPKGFVKTATEQPGFVLYLAVGDPITNKVFVRSTTTVEKKASHLRSPSALCTLLI